MDVDNIWRKRRNYKGRGKGKGHYKGSKGKGKCRSKGHSKGFDKGNTGSYNKGGYNKSKGKATQDPKAMDQTRAQRPTKLQQSIRKRKQQLHDMPPMWQALGPGLQSACVAHRKGEELHPLEQEQADQDNNEELPQDVNDTWDWYYEGEGRQHEVNYMEENWNDYDYDNSWDLNDNNYEDTANYIGHTSPLDTSDKQSHYYTSTNSNHYLERRNIMERPRLSTIPQEDTTQLHFDIAAATQQQRNKKIEDTITHYIMCSNFKSYHHLLIDSGASTHVCPKDYAPDLPLRPCGESVPQLYTVTNKKIPVYGIKYVPYKQDNFRIMIPYYVCDVKYPILSASRRLERGYGLGLNQRHCAITHGSQQAHLIRHSGLFYLRAEKIDIPTGFDIYPITTDNGTSIAVIEPTEKAKQQQEQNAPLTHTQAKDCDRPLVETLTTGNLMVTTPSEFTNDHAKHFSHGCPIPEEELDDWRLTIINRQGQEQEQLQENPSKQELQRRLEGDNWTGEIRLRRKIDNTYTQSNIKDHTHQQDRAHNRNN